MTHAASGARVALTYSPGRLRGLAARLRRGGFQVIRRPLIRVEAVPAPTPEAVRGALASPWVLFASPAAVAVWRAWGLPLDGRLFGATGPGTAQALRRLGASVAVVGLPADATGLARAFLNHPLAGGPVTLPRADRALPTLPRLLQAAGVECLPLLAYRTVPRPWEPRLPPAAVVLASPSALTALPARVANAALLVTIGATTARAARRTPATVVEAAEPTVDGVWHALHGALQPSSPKRRPGTPATARKVPMTPTTTATCPRAASSPTDLPVERPRRLRASAAIRDLVAETDLRPAQLIQPFFVVPGSRERQPITGLPGVERYSIDLLLPRIERALALGVRAVMLFGVVPADEKDADGTAAHDPNGPVPTALTAARAHFGADVVLMSDVCLCGYTDHGHCGLLAPGHGAMRVDDARSLPALAAMALLHADAGADVVAPSDMMDGRVGHIRAELDATGRHDVSVLSYAVKYASAFYGPFREAAGSAPRQAKADALPVPSDRRSYQMDPRNAREAVREARLDVGEGADILMVKPALGYLDVLANLRREVELPLAAYMVSGEYAMLKAAAHAGALDEAAAVRESLTAIRRAGADMIVTYHALEALEQGWLV